MGRISQALPVNCTGPAPRSFQMSRTRARQTARGDDSQSVLQNATDETAHCMSVSLLVQFPSSPFVASCRKSQFGLKLLRLYPGAAARAGEPEAARADVDEDGRLDVSGVVRFLREDAVLAEREPALLRLGAAVAHARGRAAVRLSLDFRVPQVQACAVIDGSDSTGSFSRFSENLVVRSFSERVLAKGSSVGSFRTTRSIVLASYTTRVYRHTSQNPQRSPNRDTRRARRSAAALAAGHVRCAEPRPITQSFSPTPSFPAYPAKDFGDGSKDSERRVPLRLSRRVLFSIVTKARDSSPTHSRIFNENRGLGRSTTARDRSYRASNSCKCASCWMNLVFKRPS